MRNITELATRAFFNGENFKLSNTEVHADCTGVYLYLWGNLIAKRVNERVSISLAGYNTVTTRERLNGILRNFNKRITTKKGIVFIIDKNTNESKEFPNDDKLRIVSR